MFITNSSSFIWIVEILIIAVITTIIYLIQRKIFNKNFKSDRITLNDGANAVLIKSLHRPLMFLIWLVGTYLSLLTLKKTGSSGIFWMVLDQVKAVGVILLFMWFANKAINGYEMHFVNKSKTLKTMLDITSIHAVVQILKIIVIITGFLSVLKVFKFDITALITVGGIGGVGVAFAARELLANFFGGVLIILDRPFEVGDWIRSPDKEIEGHVEYIGWRLTRIRTFDKRPRYIPNSVFLTLVLENASRMTHRRIKAQFGIRYSDATNMDQILFEIESMLREHADIDATQTLMVKFVSFGDSSLDIMIYTFTKTTNWVKFQTIQQGIFLSILNIISKNGAECAFPTREIVISKPQDQLPS